MSQDVPKKSYIIEGFGIKINSVSKVIASHITIDYLKRNPKWEPVVNLNKGQWIERLTLKNVCDIGPRRNRFNVHFSTLFHISLYPL